MKKWSSDLRRTISMTFAGSNPVRHFFVLKICLKFDIVKNAVMDKVEFIVCITITRPYNI